MAYGLKASSCDPLMWIICRMTGNTFKDRYNNHKYSFCHKSYRKSTELSKYKWNLKDKGINYEIQWDITRQSNISMRESGHCNLCLDEKIEISKLKGSAINKRSEIISTVGKEKKKHSDMPK